MGCALSREQVPVPQELSSLERNKWLTWKNCFNAYMDHKGTPHIKRGEKFFKYVGFLGEEIAEKFLYFAYTAHETKYDVLLFKFDAYFIFTSNGNFTRADYHSFEEYVASLENIAKKQGIKETVIKKYVREKIIQDFKSSRDFKSNNLFERLNKLDVGSRIKNYENLAIYELAFLWEECNHLESIQANDSCRFCALRHPSGKCFAAGKKCWKCGAANHFARCCQKNVVSKCSFCGSSHEIKMCPAFTKECSKCGRLNHFSWMCNTEMVDNCIYCGLSHRSGRNYCFAGHSTCMTCSKKGHYTSHCFHRKR